MTAVGASGLEPRAARLRLRRTDWVRTGGYAAAAFGGHLGCAPAAGGLAGGFSPAPSRASTSLGGKSPLSGGSGDHKPIARVCLSGGPPRVGGGGFCFVWGGCGEVGGGG